MKPKQYDLSTVMARARVRPEWPRGEKLLDLAHIANRMWFIVTDNCDSTKTLSGPTISQPITLSDDTAAVRFLNEVCSAILAEDNTDAVFTLEEPMTAPFVLPRQFIQSRVTAFRKKYRDYEPTYQTLTQQQ